MHFYTKCDDEYFRLLDLKRMELRQIEGFTIENKLTGERRTFRVENIRKLHPVMAQYVKEQYPKVPWDGELAVYAIDLGAEVKEPDTPKNEIVERIVELPEKRWDAVTE